MSTDIILLSGVAGTERIQRLAGTHQLAWWLRENGYNPQVIDFYCQMSTETVLRLFDHFISPTTRIIGLSIIGTHNTMVGEVNRFVNDIMPVLKKKYPHIIFISGGASVHYTALRYPNKSAFDYFFFGYAENGLLALCNQIFKKGQMLVPEYQQGNRVIKEKTALPPSTRIFEFLDMPHRWHERDCILPNETLPMEIARGCIFKCKFCAFPHVGKKKGEYVRLMDKVEEEMLDNYSRFGTTRYYLSDDTFNDDPDKVKAFYEMSQRLPFKIDVVSFMRADLLHANPDTPYMVQEAGFVATYFGLESFNEEAAKFVAKPWSAKHGRDYLARLRHDIWKEQVSFRSSMIIGLPGDTRKDYINWHKWFVENKIPNWSWHALLLERDLRAPWTSEIDRNAEQYGFTWINENGKNIWKNTNTGMTWRDANELFVEFEALKMPHQVTTCFGLLEEAQYCGIDPRTHNFVKVVDVDVKSIAAERKNLLNLYVTKLLSI